ncbi:MAG: hypothetical protein JRN52_14480 [Nitrososphaerota archaeon]|nr:hypothetical protein [Nitrososphaerota archaeon]
MTKSNAYNRLTINQIATLFRRKELSPVELAEYYLTRIAELDKRIRCYVAVYENKVLKAARKAEKEFSKSRYRSLLHGIPIAVKENIAAKRENSTRNKDPS